MHEDGQLVRREVGPYRIEELLGTGGMGSVYRAYDERLDRRVALKQIRAAAAADRRTRKRFLREARAAAKLGHPAIVQVYDLLESEGQDWIVMELVEGETLAGLLAAGFLELDRLLSLGLDLAGGLEAAHAQGIVHRDLKARNVLVTVDRRAKILDFGLAKRLPSDGDDSAITIEGHLLGTPAAMSPEQARGRQIDHRSDLFSLGSLLYEMMTGRSPFASSNAHETVRRVCTHRQIPAWEIRSEIPQPLSDLVDRLLEKDPAHRPQSAQQVVLALRRLAASVAASEASGSWLAGRAAAGGEGRALDEAGCRPRTERARPSELRQITVVSCELVAAAGLSDRLDPEDLFEVMPDFLTRARQVIERFGGLLANVMGHRLLVYFGYPRAHEEDVRCAVRAALELVAASERLNPRLSLRVGIHTGPAVAVTGPPQQQPLILGQTLDLATEIEAAAAPGWVLVSPVTHQLTEEFFTEEPPLSCRLPDSAEPVEVYRVLAVRGIHHRLELAPALLPLIGREEELEMLRSRWRLAREGTGQLMLLSGESGIGKSRLVYTLHQDLSAKEATWLICYGSSHAQRSPLSPVIELLRRVFELSPGLSREQQLTRLEDSLRGYGLPLGDFVPLFASLLSLPLAERYPPLRLNPARKRRKTLEAVVSLWLEMAERQPVVLVFEDLHWVDPSTLELLGLLCERITPARLLILLTCRLEFKSPWFHQVGLNQLKLNRLSREAVETLIDRVARGKRLPAAVREQIVDKTDGVPLFVEELTRALLESEAFDRQDSDNGSSGRVELAIPPTLRDSLTARLDRLGAAKEVVQLGAVLGRRFSFRLLAAVSHLDQRELWQQLDRLVRAELLLRKGLSSRAIFSFKHALIQDAAYGSLLRSTRHQWHYQIAVYLEEQFSTVDLATDLEEQFVDDWQRASEVLPLLAHHWSMAVDPQVPDAARIEKASGFLIRAGEQALKLHAYREALGHLERAFSLVAMLPESDGRDQRQQMLQGRLEVVVEAMQGRVFS